MPVLRAVARPLLASIFVLQGYDTLRHPDKYAAAAEPVVRPIAEQVPVLSGKPEQAVRINGAVQLVAGSLLALGRFPRLSALAIAATLVGERAQQQIHFLKNLSMLGGLLIASADTAGSPSVAWRTRHAAKATRKEASRLARTAKVSGKAGAKAGMKAGQVASRLPG
jgi:putative oxidoreductase